MSPAGRQCGEQEGGVCSLLGAPWDQGLCPALLPWQPQHLPSASWGAGWTTPVVGAWCGNPPASARRNLRGAQGKQTVQGGGRPRPPLTPTPHPPPQREEFWGGGAHKGQGWAVVPESSLHPFGSGAPSEPGCSSSAPKGGLRGGFHPRSSSSLTQTLRGAPVVWPISQTGNRGLEKMCHSSRQGHICKVSSPQDQRRHFLSELGRWPGEGRGPRPGRGREGPLQTEVWIGAVGSPLGSLLGDQQPVWFPGSGLWGWEGRAPTRRLPGPGVQKATRLAAFVVASTLPTARTGSGRLRSVHRGGRGKGSPHSASPAGSALQAAPQGLVLGDGAAPGRLLRPGSAGGARVPSPEVLAVWGAGSAPPSSGSTQTEGQNL